MNIFIFIIGSIILAIAITFLIKHHFLIADIRAIRATETSSIADLRKMRAKIAKEMRRVGTWREQVEVKGVVRCSRPLIAELSQRHCVYCHTKIIEEYEQSEYETDDDGDTRLKDRLGAKVIQNDRNQTNFYLEDATDKIYIDLNEAEIDGMTVVSQFESCHRQKSADYRTLGYQRTEKIIELGSEIYIIGEVKDTNGRLQIGASNDRRKPFVVSFKSEEELLKAKIAQGRHKLSWGIGLGISGSMAIAYALLEMLVAS